VIRVTTRRAAPGGDGVLQWHGLARAGTRSSSEAALGVSGGGEAVDFSIAASREASRGISAVSPDARFDRYNPDRDGFERTGVHLAGGFAPAAGHRLGASWLDSRLQAQYDAAEFPPPTFAADASPDFRNRLATRVVALDYRGRIAPAWTLSLAAGAHRDDLRSGGTVVDRFVTDRRQFTWQNAFALGPDQQAVVALDHANEAVQAATLGAVPDRRHTGVVLSWTGRLDRWRWQTDLRRDRVSVGDDQTTGKLGAGWDLGSGWSVRAVVGSAFRAPTFNDLYFPGFGVATLRSERSRSVEAGLDWTGDASPGGDGAARPSLGLTVFRNRVRDLIGFEPDPTRCPPGLAFGCAANVSDARLQGVGLEWLQPLWRDAGATLDLQARLDWLQARDLGRDEPLARRAPHQQSITLSGAEGPWTLAASLLSVAARPEAGRSVDAYRTLDLRLARRFGAGWSLEASVLNVADERYAVALDYPGPPRQFWIGVRQTGAPSR
jgi:vitamin B12 transporter